MNSCYHLRDRPLQMDPKELAAIEACQAGTPGRFDDLYQLYAEKIYRFIFFKTFHRETAEDITSDVFMKALERIGQFDAARGTFSAWIYRIARNAVIDHYRTNRTSEEIEDGWTVVSSTDVERDAETAVAFEKVQEALKLLKPEQREIVVMRLWDGLSHQEIAAILGMTESNVKQVFSRTIRRLREEFGETILMMVLAIGLGSLH
ncbi:MAG: sigma-70 family RNA polymerase sigma factor [Candidatus Uhrbacteria bacterium]|nr:sigma-70 family RNA polymerase sigma factor [Candidatus Uhrbacteria bacterium]